ncbi:hypothetical protein CRE_05516 [Caenorhabditis remanei]|uniref:G-protein coupled receptors family 1 profile domain-containing protein n=1 Tax=Caenorhabditis remanei TaxID=31234 RepID=E3LZQ7_CAERE|nr:hypothetical protein CRE_05516 [Caenorhabditis remanei]
MPESVVPVPLVLCFLTLSVVGIIGNLTIVLVTIINKTLHSRCCILIGIMAFFNIIVGIYVTQLRIMMLFGIYNILNTTCFLYSFYGIFAMNMQSILGLFIGLDRLYNVSSPIKYEIFSDSNQSICYYFCVLYNYFFVSYFFKICFSGRYSTISDITYSRSFSEEIVIVVCIPVTALYETSLQIWLCFNFVIAVSVIIVYGWTHIMCRNLRNNNLHIKTVESVNRILKSLIVVIAFYVSTWFLAMAALFIAEVLNLEGEPVYYIRRWSGWLVICNSSLHVFIYFWRTPDYRKAIIQLYRLPIRSEANSKVSVIPNNQVVLI